MKSLVTNLANNQIVIEKRDNNGALTGNKEFHSYSTKIAEFKDGKVFLNYKYWNYSVTTIKYLAEFLGFTGKKAIQEAIDNNFFIMENWKLDHKK